MARPTNALIVDDEPHVRVLLKLLLQQLGVAVPWEAADGAAGLALALAHGPELVLLDVNLPVMGGVEVLRELGVRLPGTPVIMVTSENTTKIVMECDKLGAVGYVLKHRETREVLTMLGDVIDGLGGPDLGKDDTV